MKRIAKLIFNILYSDTSLIICFISCLIGMTSISVMHIKQKIADEALIPSGVQEDFRPYVLNFIKESQKHVLPNEFAERLEHLTVKFGFPSRLGDEHDFVGWCDLNTTTVIIEKDTWNTYAEGSRQNLVDHELGHCLLERHHRPFVIIADNGKYDPVSVMFPSVLESSDYYIKHKARLYNELFEYARSNKLKEEQRLFRLNWNEKNQVKFGNEREFLRYIESVMNQDPYQPWPLKKPQMVQFDTADAMIITPKKRSRQDK